jgi:hypothetical protein
MPDELMDEMVIGYFKAEKCNKNVDIHLVEPIVLLAWKTS